MRKIYDRYINYQINNLEYFYREENENFPSDYSIYDRTISEYISFINFYNDSNKNEITYLSNDREIIDTTLKTIRELIDKEEYLLSQFHIVALQLYFDIEIKLKSTLAIMITSNMSINALLNIKKNTDTNKYERFEKIIDDNTKGKRK